MINKLTLTNFQSHKDTTLDFVPGVNAIIGPSDKGKSAILRGLYWAIYNRPSGTSFISNWAKDTSKKTVGIQKRCSVLVEKDNKYVERVRDKNLNGYVLGEYLKNKDGSFDGIGNELEAVKTDVPEEVQDFFNVGEVNIQKQMDAPFLLSSTPGEVARFFNKTINLDIIDKTLSNADSRKRTYKKKFEIYSEQAREFEESYNKLSWIDEIKPLIKDAESLETRCKSKQDTIDLLSRDLEEYQEFKKELESIPDLKQLEKNVEKADEIRTELINKGDLLDDLEETIESYSKYKEIADKKIGDFENQIIEAEKINKRITEKSNNLFDLKDSLNNYRERNSYIEQLESDIKELENSLPEVCPMCNGTGKLK